MRNTLFALALGAALTVGVPSAARAQDTAPPPQEQGQPGHGPMRMGPSRQLEHMTHELNLTADQQTQIKPLLADRQQKMQALFQDQSLSQEDRHAKMTAIRQDSQSKIEAVLTDQQKQKFEAMEQRMGHRGGPGAAPQAEAPPQ